MSDPYASAPVPRNGMGTAALVLGILALVSGLAGFLIVTIVIGVVCGIVALTLGVIGRRRASRGEATNGGQALTGVVLGVLGLLAAIVWAVLFGVLFSRVADCADLPQDSAEQRQCVEDRVVTG